MRNIIVAVIKTYLEMSFEKFLIIDSGATQGRRVITVNYINLKN